MRFPFCFFTLFTSIATLCVLKFIWPILCDKYFRSHDIFISIPTFILNLCYGLLVSFHTSNILRDKTMVVWLLYLQKMCLNKRLKDIILKKADLSKSFQTLSRLAVQWSWIPIFLMAKHTHFHSIPHRHTTKHVSNILRIKKDLARSASYSNVYLEHASLVILNFLSTISLLQANKQ